MARPSKRLALFLCLIVFHQHFIQARVSFNEHLEVSSSSRFRPRRSSKDIIEEDRHEMDRSIQEIEARHGISLKSHLGKPLHRDRRFFFTFLFIVSLVVTVAATVVETIYDIAGCCGLGFNYLCDFESDFNDRKAKLTEEAEKVDKRLEDALKKRDDLECLSEVMKSTWKSVNDMVEAVEEFVGNINANLKNLLLTGERKARKAIEDAQQELSDQDVSDLFLKKTKEQLALSLSISWATAAVPGIAAIGQKGYKTYKINKAYKVLKATKYEQVLKAAPKARKLIGFTEDSAKLFLKNTAVLKFSQKAGSFLKAMKVFKVAGAVMSIVSIALDLFNIISTFIACKEKSDKAKESCAKLQEAEQKVVDSGNNVTEFENILKTGEAKLIEQMRTHAFQTAITQIKENIEVLPPPQEGKERDLDTGYCIGAIPAFLQKVNTTGAPIEEIKDNMLDLVDNCIDKLTFSFKCLNIRTLMNTQITTSCKAGLRTFDEIYQQQSELPGNKLVLDECKDKGEALTTKEMFKQSLEAAANQAGMEFYTENCKMNSLINIGRICEGNKVSGLTDAQIQTVRTEQCKGGGAPKISPENRNSICFYFGFSYTPEEIIDEMKDRIPDLTAADINGLGCQAASEDI